MVVEGQSVDYKSLRVVSGKSADWSELAKDCVAFANAQGGKLLIGIEDGETHPPAGQHLDVGLIENVRRRIGELTVNVAVAVQVKASSENAGEFIEVLVPRSHSPASTTDGRYYLRVSDESRPLVGEEVQRLLNERGAQPWETMTNLGVSRESLDLAKAKGNPPDKRLF